MESQVTESFVMIHENNTTSSRSMDENNEDDVEPVASISIKDALDLNHMEIASNIIIPIPISISSSRASSSNDCVASCSHHGIPTPPLQLPVSEMQLEQEQEEEGSMMIEDDRPFDCSYCHKSFGNLDDCKRHERLHMGRPSLFKCSFCRRSFAQLVSKVFHEIRCPAAKVNSTTRTRKRLKSFTIQSKFQSQCNQQSSKIQRQENNNDDDNDSNSDNSNDDCEIVEEIQNENESEIDEQPTSPSSSISIITKNYHNSHAVVSSHHPSMTVKEQSKQIKGHECMYCNKLFPTSTRLRVHVRVHTGERPFSCGYCDRKFTQSGHCRSHELIHQRQLNFRGTNNPQKSNANHQIQTNTNRKSSSINSKNQQRGNRDKEKSKDVAEKGKNYEMDEIDETDGPIENFEKFKSSAPVKTDGNFKNDLVVAEADADLGSETESESESESESNDQFSSSSGALWEMNSVCPSDNEQNPEEEKEDAGKNHDPDQPELSSGSEKNLICSFCSKHFACASSLKKHLGSHKTDEKEFKSRATTSSSSTKRRQTSTSSSSEEEEEEEEKEDKVEEEGLSCRFCDKNFRRSYMRNAHEQTLHHAILASMNESSSQLQPQPQSRKNSTSSSSSHLAASTSSNSESSSFSSRKNKGKRPSLDQEISNSSNLCIYCNRLFNSRISLRLHERIHRREFPFKCNVSGCQKFFKSNSLLKTHESSHSSEVKSSSTMFFTCPWSGCHKIFKNSSLLRKHEQTHVDRGLFVCDCGEFFTNFSQLQRHERVTHV